MELRWATADVAGGVVEYSKGATKMSEIGEAVSWIRSDNYVEHGTIVGFSGGKTVVRPVGVDAFFTIEVANEQVIHTLCAPNPAASPVTDNPTEDAFYERVDPRA